MHGLQYIIVEIEENYPVDVNIEENMQIEESIKFSKIFKINERSLK